MVVAVVHTLEESWLVARKSMARAFGDARFLEHLFSPKVELHSLMQ